MYFCICIDILGVYPLKMCIAWPLPCCSFPHQKVLAPDAISFCGVPIFAFPGSVTPKRWGCPRLNWRVQSGCSPCAVLILHSAQKTKKPEALDDLCLLLVSK